MSSVGFPLLLIPLAIFNIMVFLMPGVSFAAPAFSISLMSGVTWPVTVGDLLLASGILLLMFEVARAARPGGRFLTDHLLSLAVLGGAVAEFVLLPQFGNSIYFLLTALAFVDFVSGITLRTRRARRVVTAPVRPAPAPETRARDAELAGPRFGPPPAAAPSGEAAAPPRSEPVIVPPAPGPVPNSPAANPAAAGPPAPVQPANDSRPPDDPPSR